MDSEFVYVSTFLGLRSCRELKERCRKAVKSDEEALESRNRIFGLSPDDDFKRQFKALKIEA